MDGIRRLDFGEVRMRGVAARRRAVHVGWVYGYESWRIEPGPAVPDFLLPLRARAATLAGVGDDRLVAAPIPPAPAARYSVTFRTPARAQNRAMIAEAPGALNHSLQC
ncbi:MAG TPA: hypothetical protein VMR23_06885 [Candidatus Limnocylindria bacterium]|nr:hypothetical protein [Candidatus Limnocylindria bacterium]